MKQGGECIVLGLGNEVLRDEGLGLKIVDDLKHTYTFPGLEYAKATNGGLEILDFIVNYRELIIIDTISTITGHPGDIYYYTPENYNETLHLSSSHDVCFLTAIKTGETLGFSMPAKIDILAIEIIRDLQLGQKLSNLILEKYDKILHEVANFIKKRMKFA
jgi:hydrogenase maturation protease